jgi:hypothetical protein
MGWAKAHSYNQNGHHMLFRFTINDENLVGDADHLGDRALFMAVEADHLVGATYSYDIQGQSIQKNIKNNIPNDDDAAEWFFVYAAYSHRYNKVTFFVHFQDRDEKFTISARHFYSNFHSVMIGKDAWNNPFPGTMKKFQISFCDGAYRSDYFENLYRDDLVASVGFDTKREVDCCDHCDTCETAAPCQCINCGVNRTSPPVCPCVDGYYEDSTLECVPCEF